MSTVNHLESLCVVHPDFNIWSGQARLSASDLKLGIGGEIPPEKVAQLGNKRICDPSQLRGFHRLKTSARRLLLRYGLPFMNGFAIPANKVDEVVAQLDEISVEYEQQKQAFINGYESAIDEWCQENPEYAGAIRSGALPKADVQGRIGFEYSVFMIQPVNDQSAAGLAHKVDNLGDDLLGEIVQEARTFYEDRLLGQDQCAASTAMTLRNLRDKVDGLSFLNSAFASVVSLLDKTLAGYAVEANKDGRYIVAPFFYQIMAATLILSDRQRIQQYAEGSLTVEDMTPTQGATKPIQGEAILQTPIVEEQNTVPGDIGDDIDKFFDDFDKKTEVAEESPVGTAEVDQVETEVKAEEVTKEDPESPDDEIPDCYF